MSSLQHQNLEDFASVKLFVERGQKPFKVKVESLFERFSKFSSLSSLRNLRKFDWRRQKPIEVKVESFFYRLLKYCDVEVHVNIENSKHFSSVNNFYWRQGEAINSRSRKLLWEALNFLKSFTQTSIFWNFFRITKQLLKSSRNHLKSIERFFERLKKFLEVSVQFKHCVL